MVLRCFFGKEFLYVYLYKLKTGAYIKEYKEMNIYAICGIILIALVLLMSYVNTNKKQGAVVVEDHHHDEDDSECCGQHAVCEKQRLADAKMNGAHYFEDEDLDRYRGFDADSYQDQDIEEFRYVMYTMQPEEVMEWLESLTAREIELPNELKEEAFAIINETK